MIIFLFLLNTPYRGSLCVQQNMKDMRTPTVTFGLFLSFFGVTNAVGISLQDSLKTNYLGT